MTSSSRSVLVRSEGRDVELCGWLDAPEEEFARICGQPAQYRILTPIGWSSLCILHAALIDRLRLRGCQVRDPSFREWLKSLGPFERLGG